MSESFDKQVNAQKEKNFQGSHKFPQAHEKCAMKMKQTRKKRHTCIGKPWAKHLLTHMGYVKRRGSTAAKVNVCNYEDLKTIISIGHQSCSGAWRKFHRSWSSTGIKREVIMYHLIHTQWKRKALKGCR